MLWRGLVGSTLVLLASLPVATLDATTAGRMQSLLVVLVGLGLLGSAWISLCGSVASGDAVGPGDAEGAAAGVRRVRAATVLWSGPLLLAPPLFSRDGWSYAAQGVMTHLGLSPYVWSPSVLSGPVAEMVDPVWRGTPAPYGPLPLLWGALAARVTVDPWTLVLAHRLLAVLGVALLAWAVPRLAGWTGADPARASALVLASPLMLAHGVGGLHNDVLLAGLVAASLVVARDHGWVAGALLAGLAAGVKVPGVLACVGVALLTLPVACPVTLRLRRLVQAGAVAGGVVVAAGLPQGLGLGWVRALGVPGTFSTPLSATSMLGEALGQVGAVRLVGEAVAVVLVVLVALRAPTGSAVAGLRATALVVAVVLTLSPVVHLWYLLWLVPLAACLPLGRRLGAVLVTVSLVGGLAAPLDSSLHGLYLVVLAGTGAFVALTVLLLLTQPHRARVAELVGR